MAQPRSQPSEAIAEAAAFPHRIGLHGDFHGPARQGFQQRLLRGRGAMHEDRRALGQRFLPGSRSGEALRQAGGIHQHGGVRRRRGAGGQRSGHHTQILDSTGCRAARVADHVQRPDRPGVRIRGGFIAENSGQQFAGHGFLVVLGDQRELAEQIGTLSAIALQELVPVHRARHA